MRPEPGDHTGCGLADVGVVAKFLAAENIRKVDLDDRNVDHPQGIEQRHGSVGVGAGVDDQSGSPSARTLHPVDQLGLAVGLKELDGQTDRIGAPPYRGFDVGQRLGAIDIGFPATQEVQVGPVEDQNERCIRHDRFVVQEGDQPYSMTIHRDNCTDQWQMVAAHRLKRLSRGPILEQV